jgi:hypothetical protein
MTHAAIFDLSAASYVRHPLHASGQFTETNCYVDLWIEVLHAMKRDPVAGLGFAAVVDFEGDQWTFIKPPAEDLRTLYGLTIDELNVWRPLTEHIVTQTARERLVLVEVDSFYLPDTAATDYRKNHVKTTIAVDRIDLGGGRLGYFHGPGYFELQGDDFAGLLPGDPAKGSFPLPPYVEIVKQGKGGPTSSRELVSRAMEILQGHVARRPERNPFFAYAEVVAKDVADAGAGGIDEYHRYAFATLRQFGAAFELLAVHLRWLGERGERGLSAAADHCAAIAAGTKTIVLKGARAAMTGKASGLAEAVRQLGSHWGAAMGALEEHQKRAPAARAEALAWHA